MWAFICQYWLEFLFGAIALGVTFVAKYYYNLVKTGRATKKEEEKAKDQQPIFEKIKELSDNIQKNHMALKEEMKQQNIEQDRKMEESHSIMNEQINKLITALEENNKNTEAVKSGTLALWRKTYFHDARLLLQSDHVITDDEYIKISVEHNVYNQLGGNHEGDEYFKSITIKYNAGLTK